MHCALVECGKGMEEGRRRRKTNKKAAIGTAQNCSGGAVLDEDEAWGGGTKETDTLSQSMLF